MKKELEYNGIKTSSKLWVEVPQEIYKNIKENYYGYEQNKVDREIDNILTGKSKMSEIYKKHFEKIANDTVLHHSKFSINEVLNNRELLGAAYGKTLTNQKVYDKDVIANIKTYFRLGGKGFATKPSNYPIQSVKRILEEYLPEGGTYYDPCCGWGVRMLGSINGRNDIKYLGTDVNNKLVKELNKLASDINNKKEFEYDIRCVSSTENQQDWNGKVDFVFTSPPYFLLEDYRNGEQSTKGMKNDIESYHKWLYDYMYCTLLNCNKYLKVGGVMAININAYGKFDLFADTEGLFYQMGNYELLGYEELKNISRIKSTGEMNHGNNEDIMVFRKIRD